MPNGEWSPSTKGCLSSATPSPSASRNSVMRFAEGTFAPALAITRFITAPLMPPPSFGRSGALLSATSTSPFGSTYTQRGCSSPVANAFTARPCAGVGLPCAGQPVADAICTTGRSFFSGSTSVGFGPMVDDGEATGPTRVGPMDEQAVHATNAMAIEMSAPTKGRKRGTGTSDMRDLLRCHGSHADCGFMLGRAMGRRQERRPRRCVGRGPACGYSAGMCNIAN